MFNHFTVAVGQKEMSASVVTLLRITDWMDCKYSCKLFSTENNIQPVVHTDVVWLWQIIEE